jgi:hypothetical protein
MKENVESPTDQMSTNKQLMNILLSIDSTKRFWQQTDSLKMLV